MGKAAYAWGRNVYLNLTNRCPTACGFCVKQEWGWRYRTQDLRLQREPTADEAWSQAQALAAGRAPAELVFCGYGEPTYRLPELLELCARSRRAFPETARRLNTVGLGNLIWGRDIVPKLAEALQAVSISLNTADPAQWVRLHAPAPRFRREGFEAAKDFAAACARSGLETTVTAVEQAGVDLAAVQNLAKSLGARFRPRPSLVTVRPTEVF